MSQCSSCDGCKFRKECDLAVKIDELSIKYGTVIIIPYCEYYE